MQLAQDLCTGFEISIRLEGKAILHDLVPDCGTRPSGADLAKLYSSFRWLALKLDV
jgi:hypothetical protein